MYFPQLFLLLTGLFVGSCLGVLVRRLPRNQPITVDRSRCDHCGHVLGPIELMPLASFVLQRGHCRHCDNFIGWFYPVIECAAFAVSATALYANGIGPRAWIDSGLGWALLCASWIDAETYVLPDCFTLTLILAGLAVTWIQQRNAIYNHAAAAALGYVAFRVVDAIYLTVRKRHGLGIGDAKLLGAAGAWLGVTALPGVVIAASVIAILMSLLLMRFGKLRANQIIAFGPFLALAMFSARLTFY
jgi:leader peptidase (prepilin peptidase)/N-methyltransferase